MVLWIFHALFISLYHISRPISKKSFLQHVEDLCANDNAKFQEEFAVSFSIKVCRWVREKVLVNCKMSFYDTSF